MQHRDHNQSELEALQLRCGSIKSVNDDKGIAEFLMTF